MGKMERTNVRFTKIQQDWLEKLSEKLQLDKANIVRLAITRLAEEEGVANQHKPKEPGTRE